MELITLSNGLRVFFDPDEKLRSATVGVWVLSGSRYEKAQNNGISHFIEHIVFKGSEKRSGFEIAEGMDETGAQVNAYTTKEYTFFYVKALDYQILKGADILFDMLRNPKLDKGDVETEKGVVLEEIAMYEDDPDDVCFQLNERAVFDGGSLSADILGSRQTVSSFTAEDIRAYMAERYVPSTMVIGVSGSYDRQAMKEKIEEYFGILECTAKIEKQCDVSFKKVCTVKNMPTEQNHIILSFEGIGIKHKDLYPLQLAMFILGTGTSSMLNQRIREQLGLVYSIDTWLGRYLGGGYIAVSMSLCSQSEEKAITETVKIVSDFASVITQRQTDIAKEKLISSLIMSGEAPHAKFSSQGRNQLLLEEFIGVDEIIDSIKSITLAQVKDAAERYLDLSRMSFTAVGKVKSEDEYKKIVKNAIKRR